MKLEDLILKRPQLTLVSFFNVYKAKTYQDLNILTFLTSFTLCLICFLSPVPYLIAVPYFIYVPRFVLLLCCIMLFICWKT